MKEDLLHRLVKKIPILGERLDRHMVEVISGTSVAFALKVLGAGLAFCFNLLLARTLGAEGAGVYFLVFMVISFGAILGRMGLEGTLLRFVASGAVVGDWGEVKGIYNKAISLSIVVSFLISVVIVITAPQISSFVFDDPSLVSPMRWMAVAVVPVAMLFLHSEALKGIKRIRDGVLVQGVSVPAVSVIALYLIGDRWGVKGAVWSYTIAVVVTALLGVFLWRNCAKLRGVVAAFGTKKMLKSSMPLFGVALMQFVIFWLPILLLGIWATNSDVGIFGVASRVAILVTIILFSVNSIVAPKFSEMYRQGDIRALGETARGAAKLTVLLAAPIIVFFIFFSGFVMGLFGPEFAEYGMVLIILSVGQGVNVFLGSVGYILVMSGNEPLLRLSVAGGMVISIIISLLLIPRLGVIGAAIAVAGSISFQNILASWFVYKKLSIRVFYLPGMTATVC